MRPAIAELLRCPDCLEGSITVGEVFALDEGAGDPEEMLEAVLRCGQCGEWFPVIAGVPRMLPKDLRAVLVDHYPDFYRSHAGRLPAGAPTAPPADTTTKGQVHVMEAFGFEWNEFADYENDNFDDWVTPLRPEFFDGKFGLDVGCGAGRHALKAISYGSTMLGMDLSPAVDATYAKARVTDGLDVIQGDAFRPPLQPGTFEFVYSIGVIHHTPDPPTAFQRIVPLLRPGGTIACFVYASGRPVALGILGAIRKVTTRLPLPITKFLSWLATVVDVVVPITAYRVARTLGVRQASLDRWFPEHVRIYADRSFDTNYTDWLDRLSYPYVHYYDSDDMQSWLDTAGLEQTTVNYVGTHGVVGTGAAPAVSATAGSATG